MPRAQFGKNKVVGGVPGSERDEEVWARIERREKERVREIKEYKFDMKQVEAFRYRMEDALRAVTRAAVREARIKELKTEILNSDKLKVRVLVQRSAAVLTRIWSARPTLRITRSTWSICDTTNRSIPLACRRT